MPSLSSLTKTQIRDRIRGAILGKYQSLSVNKHENRLREYSTNKQISSFILIGNAVGDAYGLATEFMLKRTAVEHYGNGPIAFGLDPG